MGYIHSLFVEEWWVPLVNIRCQDGLITEECIYTMLTIVREVAHYVDFMTEELWFACSNLSDFIND